MTITVFETRKHAGSPKKGSPTGRYNAGNDDIRSRPSRILLGWAGPNSHATCNVTSAMNEGVEEGLGCESVT